MKNARPVRRVLIADSYLLFRRGLCTLFGAETDFVVTGEASSLHEALLIAHSGPLDAILMDVDLAEDQPSGNNILAIRQLQALAPILFLARVDSPFILNLVMSVSSFGYLLKTSNPAQIVATVRRACMGDGPETENSSETAADLRALAAFNPSPDRGAPLTLREQEILRLLAEGHTVRETAAELSVSMKTVDAHKLNLMRKLDIHDRAALIEYAMSKGFIQTVVAA